MLSKLEQYYKEHGILSTAFTCRHRLTCSRNSEKFTGPKSAYIGTEYEDGQLPRLLFLSLDSGSGELGDIERLPSAVRRQEEIECEISKLPKNRHWFRTHELAWYILRRFKSDLELDEAKRYFAHANSAKCCMNYHGNKKAPVDVFKNCERYLKGEIAILSPKIIVTQGNEARDAVNNMASVQHRLDDFASVIKIDGREIFWLHTWHPNNWGAFNNHRRPNKKTEVPEGWEHHASQIEQFVRNNV